MKRGSKEATSFLDSGPYSGPLFFKQEVSFFLFHFFFSKNKLIFCFRSNWVVLLENSSIVQASVNSSKIKLKWALVVLIICSLVYYICLLGHLPLNQWNHCKFVLIKHQITSTFLGYLSIEMNLFLEFIQAAWDWFA